MKRILPAVFASIVIAAPVLAADLPARPYTKAPIAVTPVYNWTGFYVGGNVGYSWGKANAEYNEPVFAGILPVPLLGSSNVDGIIGGGQIGYNWQANNWVLGIEADFQGSGQKGSFANPHPYDVGRIFVLTHLQETKLDWFGTVRGRVGVLVTPTVLLYGTAGLAYGKLNVAGGFRDTGAVDPWFYGVSTTRTGWTAGAGIEGAIPSSRDWTWKLEYLYVDLGTVRGSGIDCCDFVGPFTWSTRFTDNIVRAGVNYRFH